MGPIGHSEIRLRIEWLLKNRNEVCPECSHLSPHKSMWDFTRFCSACNRIWRTHASGNSWSFELDDK